MAFLFAAAAETQHWFVQKQLYNKTAKELGAWGARVSSEILDGERWDLQGYRRASITAPAWIVTATNGLILDIEGFVPGFFGKVGFPQEITYQGPQTYTTPIGEQWRIVGSRLSDGAVLLGVSYLDGATGADAKLASSASRFGTNLAKARTIKSREIDFEVDYGLVDSQGHLLDAWGGLPLMTGEHIAPFAQDHLETAKLGGVPYAFYYQAIRTRAGVQLGTVIIPKDMSIESKALGSLNQFNLWLVGLATLLACVVPLGFVIKDLIGQSKSISLKEALRIGETLTIEFKSSFQWDINANAYLAELRLATLKTIAAFLNSKGGTLFIGVCEQNGKPVLLGIAKDLRYAGNSKDQLRLALRHLITDRIGSQFAPFITDSIEEADGECYWRISVAQSPEPAYVH